MLLLDIDEEALEELVDEVGATDQVAKRAAARALRRTIRHVGTKVRRDVSAATDIPQKVIRSRMSERLPKRGGSSAAIWVGLNPINPAKLRARQTKKGVRARRHLLEGAFLANGRGGNRRAFIRRGKARLPLDVVNIHIHQDALRAIRSRTFREATEFYMRQFRHELDFGMKNAG